MEAVVREQTAKLDQLIALANRGKGAYWAGIFVATGIGSAITFLLRFFNLKIGT